MKLKLILIMFNISMLSSCVTPSRNTEPVSAESLKNNPTGRPSSFELEMQSKRDFQTKKYFEPTSSGFYLREQNCSKTSVELNSAIEANHDSSCNYLFDIYINFFCVVGNNLDFPITFHPKLKGYKVDLIIKLADSLDLTQTESRSVNGNFWKVTIRTKQKITSVFYRPSGESQFKELVSGSEIRLTESQCREL